MAQEQENDFTIKSRVEFVFNEPQTCDFSYNAFLPEFNKLNTKRSKLKMEKKQKSLIIDIESSDITAFRASISEIIGLGKIINGTMKICR
jgi:tRNA threonylcarbamoyladenosine modification (KEOPS) complex  Pcc1 subunit